MNFEEISKTYPVVGKRVFTIAGGAKVALRICEALGVEELTVSTYGARFGVLLDSDLDLKYLLKG